MSKEMDNMMRHWPGGWRYLAICELVEIAHLCTTDTTLTGEAVVERLNYLIEAIRGEGEEPEPANLSPKPSPPGGDIVQFPGSQFNPRPQEPVF